MTPLCFLGAAVLALSVAHGARADDDEAPYLVNPCAEGLEPWASQDWCDSTLSMDTRITDMLSRMNISEKIASLGTSTPAIDSLGLPKYNWWSEASHGLADGHRIDDTTPVETNFAFPTTTAQSFNRSLWLETGRRIGVEARAFSNAGNGYSTFWAPVVNLARDPRWGRNIEIPGEDPYLTGQYSVNFVKGFQLNPDDQTHLQASACCKHYVANSMEDSTVAGTEWDRYHFDAQVTMQDLVDSYMFPFQQCVEMGDVSSLMCSYNAVNGVPSCANDWLLQTVARDEWGFNGYITSDCDADSDVYFSHNFTDTPEQAVAAVLAAGTDVDCVSFVPTYAQSALDQGMITEADIDARLHMLFAVRMRLGHFDPPSFLDTIQPSELCSDESMQAAAEGTRQAVVLLKNDRQTLPLDAAALGQVAVIGPNSNLSYQVAGYYGGLHPCGMNFWSMIDAISQAMEPSGGTVEYLSGVPDVSSDDVSGVADAVTLAQDSDAVVLVLGTDLTTAREGNDAVNITLSDGQTQLATAVAAAVGADKPVVMVLLTATPLDLGGLATNDNIASIVHAGQPSVQTLPVGDVLFGNAVPAGRLIQTWYPREFQDMISIFDMNMRPGPSAWPRPDCPAADQPDQCDLGTNPGRTHRFYTGDPLYEFGFGLSYTTFSYALARTPDPQGRGVGLGPVKDLVERTQAQGRAFVKMSEALAPLDDVAYQVNVTNTGSVDADDVVLGFVVPPDAGTNGIPLQSLFGFERVHVPAGQTVSVWLMPALLDFTVVHTDGTRRAHPGRYTIRFGVLSTAQHGQGLAEHSLQTTL